MKKRTVDLETKLDVGIDVTLIDDENTYHFIKSDEIVYLTKEDSIALVTLCDGKTLKSVQTYEDLRKLLLKKASFVTVQRGTIANLELVKSIKPLSRSKYLITFQKGESIEITSAYTDGVKKYFNLSTLDHVTPFDRPSYWLMKENISWYEKPIHFMKKEELLENFSDQSGNPIVSRIIANFLYQHAIRIREGLAEPFEGGNVRSLWYVIKPAIFRLGVLENYDHYKTVSEVLARLVRHKIVTYKEYGLSEEENWVYMYIRKKGPHFF